MGHVHRDGAENKNNLLHKFDYPLWTNPTETNILEEIEILNVPNDNQSNKHYYNKSTTTRRHNEGVPVEVFTITEDLQGNEVLNWRRWILSNPR